MGPQAGEKHDFVYSMEGEKCNLSLCKVQNIGTQ